MSGELPASRLSSAKQRNIFLLLFCVIILEIEINQDQIFVLRFIIHPRVFSVDRLVVCLNFLDI